MRAEEAEQFALFRRELRLRVAAREYLLLRVEGEAAYFVERAVAVFLAAHAAQNGLDAERELFHREGFCQIVVGAELKAFEDVFFQRFGSEEDDGYFLVVLADVLSQREAVLFRHHDVEDAEVEFFFQEGFVAGLAVGAEFRVVALGLQVFSQEHAEVLVVLAQQDFHFVVHDVKI